MRIEKNSIMVNYGIPWSSKKFLKLKSKEVFCGQEGESLVRSWEWKGWNSMSCNLMALSHELEQEFLYKRTSLTVNICSETTSAAQFKVKKSPSSWRGLSQPKHIHGSKKSSKSSDLFHFVSVLITLIMTGKGKFQTSTSILLLVEFCRISGSKFYWLPPEKENTICIMPHCALLDQKTQVPWIYCLWKNMLHPKHRQIVIP